jgi:hypothetical protein
LYALARGVCGSCEGVIGGIWDVDFNSAIAYCVVVGGVFYFMGDATVIYEALDIAEVVAIAVGTGYSTIRMG